MQKLFQYCGAILSLILVVFHTRKFNFDIPRISHKHAFCYNTAIVIMPISTEFKKSSSAFHSDVNRIIKHYKLHYSINNKCIKVFTTDSDYLRSSENHEFFERMKYTNSFEDILKSNVIIDFNYDATFSSILTTLKNKIIYNYGLNVEFTSRPSHPSYYEYNYDKFKLSPPSGKPQLVIISGMYDDLTVEIIADLLSERNVRTSYYLGYDKFKKNINEFDLKPDQVYSVYIPGAFDIERFYTDFIDVFDILTVVGISPPQNACYSVENKLNCIESYIEYYRNVKLMRYVDVLIEINLLDPLNVLLPQVNGLISRLNKADLVDIQSEFVMDLSEYRYNSLEFVLENYNYEQEYKNMPGFKTASELFWDLTC